MTYGDLYDRWLEELYQVEMDKIQLLRGCSVARIIAEFSPTDYRCGFADWSDQLAGVRCSECAERREVDVDIVRDANSDDEVLCSVCKGDSFVCATCYGVFSNDGRAAEDRAMCKECYDDSKEEDEDDGDL